MAIYAINEFITMSLLPSAVAYIGGERLYAWVTTVYLVSSVVSATTVGPVLTRFGPRWSYLGALLSFSVGSGVDDATVTFSGTLAAVTAALVQMRADFAVIERRAREEEEEERRRREQAAAEKRRQAQQRWPHEHARDHFAHDLGLPQPSGRPADPPA